MLNKRNIIVLVGLFLFNSLTYAGGDQVVTDLGLGAFSTEGYSISQVKLAKVGLQEDVWYPFKQRFNVGGWLDNRGPGYSNSLFAGYQIGFEVSNQVFQSNVFFGPSLISSPDTVLGGPFQFNVSAFFGIKDSWNDSIGIGYNHFSSASIEMPNQGRDFLGLEFKCPF